MTRLLTLLSLLWLWCVPTSADVSVRVVQVPADLDNGTQDITIPGWGYTPKGAIVWVTNATTNATPVAHLHLGYGVTDCTRAITVGMTAQDAVVTSETWRASGVAGTVVKTMSPGGTTTGEATIDSCIANGIRIDWGTNPPESAFLLQAVLFAGTDLTAYASSFTTNAALDGTTDVTAPGFEPDDVFLIGASIATLGASATGPGQICAGIATNTGTPFQGSVGHWMIDNATSESQAIATTQYGCYSASASGVAVEIGGWDASGFTATTRVTGLARVFGYLALHYGGAVAHWAGMIDTPVAGGPAGYTAPGFTPQAVLLLSSLVTVANTIRLDATGAEAATTGISAMTATEAYGCAVTNEDNVATSDVQARCDDQAALLPLEDFSTGFAATFVSMDPTGWTLNFATTQVTAAKWVAWAIGDNPGAAAVQRRRGLQW